MRLAFVSILNPEDPGSWSGTLSFALKALREQNIDVEAVAPLDQKIKYLLAVPKLVSRLRNDDAQLDRRPMVLRSYARQIENRIAGRGFDAIFSMSTIPVSALAPGLPVLTWTDAVFESMSGYYQGSFRSHGPRTARIAHQQEQRALDRVSYAIYSSQWALDEARANYTIADGKLQVIRFGANLPVSHTRDQIGRWIECRARGGCKLLFLGVDWQRKGGPIAMEATRILRERGVEASLIVAGCKAPDAPYVENLGFISKRSEEGRRRIEELLRTSTFLLFPTRAEASAIVFCEASAFGLPIVTSATGGTGDYVKNGVSGYCLPLAASAAAYADRIQSALEDSALYRRLSWGAYEEFLDGLNWSAGASRLAALAEEAIRSSRGVALTGPAGTPAIAG